MSAARPRTPIVVIVVRERVSRHNGHDLSAVLRLALNA